MIVSHSRKFIFLAVPKTGTQAIRAALRAHLDDGIDWEQSAWDGARQSPIDALARIGHGHISAREAQRWLAPDSWAGYFKFAFVRNPWDRFLSSAFFRNADRPLFQSHPRGYLTLLLDSPRTWEDPWYAPQHTFLLDGEGRLAPDFVGRFERLQDDFDDVCRHIGLPPERLRRLNASTRDSAHEYYDEALVQKVEACYAEDIRSFGYAGQRPGAGSSAGRHPA